MQLQKHYEGPGERGFTVARGAGCRQHTPQERVLGSRSASARPGSSQLSSSSTCTAQGEGFAQKGTTCSSPFSAVVQILCLTYGSCSACMYPSAIQLLGSGQNTYTSPFRVVCNQGFVLPANSLL